MRPIGGKALSRLFEEGLSAEPPRALASQRKPSWTASDVSRFSELLQTEHAVQAEETAARRSLRDAEESVDAGLVAFMDALRERYQQEQVRCVLCGAAWPSATH